MQNKIINKKYVISAISLLLFIILTILIFTNVTTKLDDRINSLMLSINNQKLTNIMIVITNIGSAYSLISITLLISLIAIIKNKRLPINTIINLFSVFIISQILKTIFHRARPLNEFLVTATGYSYPSGHTMVSFAYFMFISYSLSQKIENKLLKIVLNISSFILIFLIGISRIYLGVHFFTDVIAGYLLAISHLMIFLNIREKRGNKWKLLE